MTDGAPTPGQGQTAAPPQPQAGGQGPDSSGGTTQGQPEGIWGMFPDVPEEQRPLLEPHLKNVQGHVTKLEQQMAPFKPLTDAGLSPEDAVALVQFNQMVNQDPIEAWLRMGTQLQESQLVHGDLDLEAVASLARGQAPPEEEASAGATPPSPEDGGEIPPWAQEMQQSLQKMQEESQQRVAEAQRQAEDAQFQQVLESMKGQLQESGFPEDAVSDETLTAHVIAHNGNADAALQGILGMRESVLKGYTQQRSESSGGPEMPKGAPKSDKKPTRTRSHFAEANTGARQFLEAQQAAAAQE